MEIKAFLSEFEYALIVVDTIEDIGVVVQKYMDHPENIIKNSVRQWSECDYNVFVMKDRAGVEHAETEGGTRLPEIDLQVSF